MGASIYDVCTEGGGGLAQKKMYRADGVDGSQEMEKI